MQPALREAIELSGLDFARNGRALVPGCGSVCGRVVLDFKTLGVHPNYDRDTIFHISRGHWGMIPWVLMLLPQLSEGQLSKSAFCLRE